MSADDPEAVAVKVRAVSLTAMLDAMLASEVARSGVL